MKLTKSIFGIALTAIGFGALVSCSNELSDPSRIDNGTVSLKLVKTPDVIAWSGSQYLFDATTCSFPTRADNPEGIISGIEEGEWNYSSDNAIGWIKVKTDLINRTEEEELIDNKLPEYNDNLEEIENMDLDFLFYAKNGDLSFELYPIFSSTGTGHDYGIFWYDQNGIMHKEIIWESINSQSVTETSYGGYLENNNWVQVITYYSKGIKIKVKKGYKFGFYINGHFNEWDKVEGNENYLTTYYTTPSLNKECYVTNGFGNLLTSWEERENNPKSKIHAGLFVENNKSYLGLEDWTDFDFQDLVFTCNQILPTVKSDNTSYDPGFEEKPGVTPKEPCETCGHLHDGPSTDCEECKENGPAEGHDESCWKDPQPGNPNKPTVGTAGSEVEVNLSINDKDNQGDIEHLVSKLSIHVRYPHDVRITIPVPAVYQVDQDDLYIFNEHYGPEAVYGGQTKTITYSIGNEPIHNVTLTIEHDLDNDQIIVTTSGIDEDVFEYCRTHYGDGLNFEVYNYFNYFVKEEDKLFPASNAQFEEAVASLKYYLDQATIEFIKFTEAGYELLDKEECPDYYINAFTDHNGKWNHDCDVNHFLENQSQWYSDSKTGHHLNGSKYNEIYKKDGVTNNDSEYAHDHEFLWSFDERND